MNTSASSQFVNVVNQSLNNYQELIVPVSIALVVGIALITIMIKGISFLSTNSSKYGKVMIKTGLRKKPKAQLSIDIPKRRASSTSTAFETNSTKEEETKHVTPLIQRLSDIVDQSKNLADFFQRISGISVLQQCKFGSCQYAGVVSAIDAMKILKEHGVDPLELFGIQMDILRERILEESDALHVLTIQLAALTSNEANCVMDFSSLSNLGNTSASNAAIMRSYSTTSLSSLNSFSSVESSAENLSVFYATSSPAASPRGLPDKFGYDSVAEENQMKFANISSVDEVFKTMRDSSFDLWTVSRLAFQSAFNRELSGFVSLSQCHVPAQWLTREMNSDSASSFRTGLECFILEQMGFIKNIDDALQDFQT